MSKLLYYRSLTLLCSYQIQVLLHLAAAHFGGEDTTDLADKVRLCTQVCTYCHLYNYSHRVF